ncbi:hypothetical protein NDU88_005657 [Pleurodeles waltl]|uniref:Uncharacterized protein n=1 Tax=Pleurodeles waltl TaxID=8319 RepID=A0AAV7TBE0_PLEWA|nr:hypothetical protein NDU88_005657 [Pleurodeles waltl]
MSPFGGGGDPGGPRRLRGTASVHLRFEDTSLGALLRREEKGGEERSVSELSTLGRSLLGPGAVSRNPRVQEGGGGKGDVAARLRQAYCPSPWPQRPLPPAAHHPTPVKQGPGRPGASPLVWPLCSFCVPIWSPAGVGGRAAKAPQEQGRGKRGGGLLPHSSHRLPRRHRDPSPAPPEGERNPQLVLSKEPQLRILDILDITAAPGCTVTKAALRTFARVRAESAPFLLALSWRELNTARSPQASAGDPPCGRGRGSTPRSRSARVTAAASSWPR